jgi:chromosomal replication initiator protein
MDIALIWQNVLGELEVTLSKANFQTWFRGTFIADFKKGYFTIGVPNFFAEDWLKKKYLKEILKALQHQVDEEVLGIKFKIAAPPANQSNLLDKGKVIHKAVDNSNEQLTPLPTAKNQTLPTNTTLNDYYKFEDFIVGSSNQLSYAAALAVANNPGVQYNPLFIYGDSGLGKTHLMQAIGQALLEKDPSKKVLYVSSETFVNEFINAVESGRGKAADFKDRYRNVDLLLIDDIQFLGRKESTQEEFFHTFNHLHQNKKQVVLTADCHPKAIKGLEVRLQTRFEGGMVTDISQPDLETREAILRQKAKRQNKEIDNEVIRYIAERIQSSIRELEGVLTKVIATCELIGTPVTLEKTAEILSGFVEEKKQAITADLIIREVHRYFKIPIEELLGKKRNKELVVPRQITMYLLRHEANLSYPEIGREMSGKDHSTIIHGCHKVEADISNNQRVKDDLFNIKERIYSIVK